MACAASYLFCLFLIPHAIRDSASHCTGVLSGWEGSGPERTRLCNPPPHLIVAHLQVGNTWFLWRASKERGARGPNSNVGVLHGPAFGMALLKAENARGVSSPKSSPQPSTTHPTTGEDNYTVSAGVKWPPGAF